MTTPITFAQAAGQDATYYLEHKAYPYYAAVQTAHKRGNSPDEIYQAVLREVGEHREPLARRCRQMAYYLQGVGE